MRRCVRALLVSPCIVAAVALLLPGGAATAAKSPHTGHPATCAKQSGASFPNAFTSRANLVAGPLAMIGAGRYTPRATVEEFGGNKFPLLVKAGRTVTVRLSGRASRSGASLLYAIPGSGARTVADGRSAITFRSCTAAKAQSDADGEPVTFWSGFVLVSKPMCVRLKVWVDDVAQPRRERIALGRRC